MCGGQRRGVSARGVEMAHKRDWLGRVRITEPLFFRVGILANTWSVGGAKFGFTRPARAASGFTRRELVA